MRETDKAMALVAMMPVIKPPIRICHCPLTQSSSLPVQRPLGIRAKKSEEMAQLCKGRATIVLHSRSNQKLLLYKIQVKWNQV